ncbi:hypothetical protein BV898_15883 [Hypsibius exemplaris]|uniref:Uncharacterized protein n=1 Tax=Hypsibius exemplaris TaxID=2072580 RepID=A0A9X6NCH2_HYPEX|nr:hypothetical protein BV898_15883 [Hypsibius exemplaris]
MHWDRVGLQTTNRRQEDDIFIWNSAVAHMYSSEMSTFIRVSLVEAGYYSMALKDLEEVTVCLNEPNDDVIRLLRGSLSKITWISSPSFVWPNFSLFPGQCLLACRPRFIHDVLHLKVPSIVVIGPSDTRKTTLVEICLLFIGSDRKTGPSFSHKHISEYEFGKRTLKCTLPMLVSDPPLNNANQYAELVQHVFDGARHRNAALTYDTGAGPILAINADFLKAWQKTVTEAWNRVRSRLVPVGVETTIAFPAKDEDLYRRAQSLSSYLPDLLRFPEKDLCASMVFFKDTLAESVPAELGGPSALQRSKMGEPAEFGDYPALRCNTESLALFYTFGELVGKVVAPDFDFRSLVNEHAINRSFSSVAHYLAQIVGGAPLSMPSARITVEEVILDILLFALDPLKLNYNKAIAIRGTLNAGLFGKHKKSLRLFLDRNTQSGCYDRVSLRVPKTPKNMREQEAQHCLFFYVADLLVKLQHQLLVMDIVACDAKNRLHWDKAARTGLSALDEIAVDALDFHETACLASPAVADCFKVEGVSEAAAKSDENAASQESETSMIVIEEASFVQKNASPNDMFAAANFDPLLVNDLAVD